MKTAIGLGAVAGIAVVADVIPTEWLGLLTRTGLVGALAVAVIVLSGALAWSIKTGLKILLEIIGENTKALQAVADVVEKCHEKARG